MSNKLPPPPPADLPPSTLKYLNIANETRKSLENRKPQLSNFVVVALITYYIKAELSDSEELLPSHEDDSNALHIIGANAEPCSLTGSLCAERCAFAQLRLIPNVVILNVYIVSDSSTPITPGMLCREYMMSFVDGELDSNKVRMILGGCNKSTGVIWDTVQSTILNTLYPGITVYNRRSQKNIQEFVEKVELCLDCVEDNEEENSVFTLLHHHAQEVSKMKGLRLYCIAFALCLFVSSFRENGFRFLS